MVPAQTVEFFFSPGSRYSYLAASQIASLEAATGCTVQWRPVSGTDIRKFRGRDPFEEQSVSGQYDWKYREQDARRWADFYGIPYREPPDHQLDFGLLVRAAAAAQRLGRAADYGPRICAGAYGTDIWPVDKAVCIALAQEIGLSAELFTAALEDPETDHVLAATAEEAFRRGAFGVPTFFVGEKMFWGNDRLIILKHFLEKQVWGAAARGARAVDGSRPSRR